MNAHEEIDLDRVYSEHSVLDIGEDVGALIIYTRDELLGREIEVSPRGCSGPRTHTAVLKRRVDGRVICAALFLELPEGDYTLWGNRTRAVGEVTINGGQVAEVDWREVEIPADMPVNGAQLQQEAAYHRG